MKKSEKKDSYFLCGYPLHPEYNSQFCACAGCRPVGFCVDDPCAVCEGPVKIRCRPEENEKKSGK
mgnify:CR=1